MNDFSATLRNRAGMAGPGAPPGPMGQPPAGGDLVQALRAANAALVQAIQTGDLPPEALAEIQKFAQIIAQIAQAGARQGPPQGAPPGAPPGGPAA